jgi:hypothetical protein
MPLRRQPRGHNEGMHVELLTIPGCPHGISARELFARALELEGADPGLLTVREIATDGDAAAASFHGSPTFTIDGKDLFPSNAAPAVTCRIYPGQHGLSWQPTLESLREAICAAAPRDQREPEIPRNIVEPTRDEILAGYSRARRDLQAWLESATPADLRRESNGTRWTNKQLLFHMVFGYMVVRVLLSLVHVVSRLPKPVGRAFAAALNAGTAPFDLVNYWGSRAAALVYNRRRMGRKLEKTVTALSRRLQREDPRSLAGSMPFPHGWDLFFTPVMTVNDVYAYPTKHFDFHAMQLSLQRPDQP